MDRRGAAGKASDALNVLRPHDGNVVLGHVRKYCVELDVLLCGCPDQIVVRRPRQREDWLPVKLGVIETVEQVQPTRSRRRETHAESSRELGVCAGHERRRFFVSQLDKANLVLTFPHGLHDPVDAVTRQSEDDLDAPIAKDIDENIRRGILHYPLPSMLSPRRLFASRSGPLMLPRRGRLSVARL